MLPAGKVAVRKQHPLPIVWPLSAGDNASPDNEDGSSAVETGNEASEAFEALKGARTAAFDPRVVGKLRCEEPCGLQRLAMLRCAAIGGGVGDVMARGSDSNMRT